MINTKFEPCDRMVVWSWDGAHRMLVSIISAEPTLAEIEYGGQTLRRRKWVPYDKLSRRDNGGQVTQQAVIDNFKEPDNNP